MKKLQATVIQYIERIYSRRQGSQRQLLTRIKNLNGKYKKDTKILTHVSGLKEDQSSDKSDDEDRNQQTS